MKASGFLCTAVMLLLLGFDTTARSQDPVTQGGQMEREEWALGDNTVTLQAGGQYGIAAFGSKEAHHLALVSLSYGHKLGQTACPASWCRGQFELRGELFGGVQFSPDDHWIIGLTPHLRYNFLRSTRWIPFVDGGAGVTATSIGPPDLSNTFEFNLQIGGGIHWQIRRGLALTADLRYIHLSCAGLSKPNLGVNGFIGLLGVTHWF